jgi:hypothetical protein
MPDSGAHRPTYVLGNAVRSGWWVIGPGSGNDNLCQVEFGFGNGRGRSADQKIHHNEKRQRVAPSALLPGTRCYCKGDTAVVQALIDAELKRITASANEQK